MVPFRSRAKKENRKKAEASNRDSETTITTTPAAKRSKKNSDPTQTCFVDNTTTSDNRAPKLNTVSNELRSFTPSPSLSSTLLPAPASTLSHLQSQSLPPHGYPNGFLNMPAAQTLSRVPMNPSLSIYPYQHQHRTRTLMTTLIQAWCFSRASTSSSDIFERTCIEGFFVCIFCLYFCIHK